jgi:hypothetical protein
MPASAIWASAQELDRRVRHWANRHPISPNESADALSNRAQTGNFVNAASMVGMSVLLFSRQI